MTTTTTDLSSEWIRFGGCVSLQTHMPDVYTYMSTLYLNVFDVC